MAGRKRLHDFDNLKPGERLEATGPAKVFRFQYARNYNARKFNPPTRKVRVITEKMGDGSEKVYFEKE